MAGGSGSAETNNFSGTKSGVSVQGYLLLHNQRLYLTGGNAISVAAYDVADGKFIQEPNLNLQERVNQINLGRELFLVEGSVAPAMTLLYSPESLKASGYAQDRVRAFTNDVMVIHSIKQGNNLQAPWLPADILCYDRGAPPGNSPPRWTAEAFVQCTALAVAKNAVVIGGADPKRNGPTTYGLMALDLVSGRKLWAVPLKAAPTIFGIAIDRRGRVIASLEDGSVLAFGG